MARVLCDERAMTATSARSAAAFSYVASSGKSARIATCFFASAAPAQCCAPEEYSGQKNQGRGLGHDLHCAELGGTDADRVVSPEVHRGCHDAVVSIEARVRNDADAAPAAGLVQSVGQQI